MRMTFLKKTSIKRKQTLIVMLTSGVALLLACVAFSSYEVMTFRAAMVENLSTLTAIIGDNSSAALDFADPKAAKETLSALQAEPNIEAGCIYTAKGQVFAVYQRPGNGTAFEPPVVQLDNQYFSKDALVMFRPIVRDGETLGTVYVVSDLSALYSRLDRYILIAVGVLFASGLVAFLLSSWLGRLISGPILSLVQTTRAVTEEKNYSVRAVKHSDDELGVLIDGFNEMLRQIQERDAALQKTHIELEKRVAERTEEVVNSLSLVRATLESTTDGILATDRDGRVTSFNEKFVEMWQIPPEVLSMEETQKMAEAVSPQLTDPEQFLSKISLVYAEPEKESFDLIEFKDGKIFERYSKLQRVADKCVGRVWSFRDITERKRSEVELEENRRLLNGVLGNAVDGIVAYEAVRDEQGTLMDFRFLLVNPAAERLLGQPAAELIGQGLLDTSSDIVLDGLFEPFVRIVETGATLDFEYSAVRSKILRWYRVAGVKLGDGLVMSYSDITERKRAEAELEQMHKQLVDTSRQAGMAEVATSVLHNVGNVLNSVNVSSTLVSNQVRKSKVASLSKVVQLLNEHASDIGTFLTNDSKGKQLPGYLAQLAEHLVEEQVTILKELKLLHENIEHIKDIVVMQQSYAKVSGVVETVNITDLVEDALRLNLGGLQRHGVEVLREFETIPNMDVEKHKILQILVNLVRNAKYACDESVRIDKLMKLRVVRNNGQVEISVIDNGIGIPPENLTRIFNHGFTTRKEGHGFGLHSAVLAAMEMGGALKVYSDGTNKGATFTLELPYTPHKEPRNL
jgi:PAS domain S-box-containing protein